MKQRLRLHAKKQPEGRLACHFSQSMPFFFLRRAKNSEGVIPTNVVEWNRIARLFFPPVYLFVLVLSRHYSVTRRP
jgi:hypothetical protein